MSAWHMRGNSCAAQSGRSQGIWLQGFSPVEERLGVDTTQKLFIRRLARTAFLRSHDCVPLGISLETRVLTWLTRCRTVESCQGMCRAWAAS